MAKCKVIGSFGKHKLPTGCYDDAPYLSIGEIIRDGTGVQHVRLYARCDRCGEKYHAASIHLDKDVKI